MLWDSAENTLLVQADFRAVTRLYDECVHIGHSSHPGFSVVLFAVDGKTQTSPGSRSKFNEQEVEAVTGIVNSVLAGGKPKVSVSAITLYPMQQRKIRESLVHRMWEAKAADLRVGTADSVQGTETDLVVISTMRSHLRLPADTTVAQSGSGPSSAEDMPTSTVQTLGSASWSTRGGRGNIPGLVWACCMT